MPEATTEIDSPSQEPEERRPPRRVIGGSCAGWLTLAAAGLFFLILAAALWYALAPVSLARLVGRLAARPLNIEGLAVTVDRRPVVIPPGGALVVTPRQKIAVGALVSNRWLNFDLSLASPDFELARVAGGQAAAPADFLDASLFRPAVALRLDALDQGRPAAEFRILVHYETRDYAAWAARIGDPRRRAEIYRKILELDPEYPGAGEELAASLASAGRPAEAAAVYEEMLDSRPGEAGAEMLARLLDLYVGLDWRDRQPAVLKRLVDATRAQGLPAISALRRFVEMCGRNGRLELADEVLKGLWPKAPPEEAADILGELALLSRRRGDVRGEIAVLKKLAELAPPERAREIWSGLLALYEAQGDEAGR
ncbi:MAG: hypothetical protein LBV70_07580, partial [Candidatus Adiutrix sp.]|nr:hypothetical protein [Candidatus Adiutrix sp.]